MVRIGRETSKEGRDVFLALKLLTLRMSRTRNAPGALKLSRKEDKISVIIMHAESNDSRPKIGRALTVAERCSGNTEDLSLRAADGPRQKAITNYVKPYVLWSK